MPKNPILLLLAAALLPASAFATAVTTVYNAGLGTLPEAQGFSAFIDSPIVPAVSGGILDVDAYTQGNNSREAYYTDINGTFLFSSFVMEANLKIVNSTQQGVPGGSGYPRAGLVLSATDNLSRTIQVLMVENGLWLQTSDGTAYSPAASSFLTFNTTDAFHNYRLEGDGSAAVKLYIDHAVSAALTFNIASMQSGDAANDVYFGDASFLTRSHYQVKSFLFSSDINAQVSATPEPGTLSLLFSASAGLWYFRKRSTQR